MGFIKHQVSARRQRRPWFIRCFFRYSILAGVLLLATFFAYERAQRHLANAWQGTPQAVSWHPLTWTRVLRNRDFLIGWSDLRGNPLWVEYRLKPLPKTRQKLPRPQRFSSDWRALNAVSHEDYNGSGFDRGHLAPNFAISQLYGLQAQLQTFRMTNVSPQRKNLNRRVWQRLEEIEIQVYARRYGDLRVLTGPVFDKDIERLKSSLRVEIPDAFYKILVAPEGDGQGLPKLLAFVIPQNVQGGEALSRFVTPVDRIEELTGFDFFPDMPAALQNRLEATVETRGWSLEKYGERPPRY